MSTAEVGRRGESDDDQLLWATNEGRAILTFDVRDFARLHARWMTERRRHTGIVVSQQRAIGDVLSRLFVLWSKVDAESMVDRLEFLGDWGASSAINRNS